VVKINLLLWDLALSSENPSRGKLMQEKVAKEAADVK